MVVRCLYVWFLLLLDSWYNHERKMVQPPQNLESFRPYPSYIIRQYTYFGKEGMSMSSSLAEFYLSASDTAISTRNKLRQDFRRVVLLRSVIFLMAVFAASSSVLRFSKNARLSSSEKISLRRCAMAGWAICPKSKGFAEYSTVTPPSEDWMTVLSIPAWDMDSCANSLPEVGYSRHMANTAAPANRLSRFILEEAHCVIPVLQQGLVQGKMIHVLPKAHDLKPAWNFSARASGSSRKESCR